MKSFRSILLTMCVLALASVAFAQAKGKAQITGTVVDEQGQPIEDVQIKAVLTGAADAKPVGAKTNKKGEWTIKNLAAGEWAVDFAKEGLGPKTEKVKVGDGEKVGPVAVKLGKYVDPNTDIQNQAQVAADLFGKKQFADARKIYEDLLVKYPAVYQLQPMIARTYAAENNFPMAVEHMRLALEKEPDNPDNRLFLGELLIETGDKDEARKLIEGTDIAQAKDPYPFLNIAITLINAKKPDEALAILDKVAGKFPDQAEVYYYRGRAYLAAQKLDLAKTDLEKFVAMSPPGTREVGDAKNILDQLNKK